MGSIDGKDPRSEREVQGNIVLHFYSILQFSIT